MKRIAPPARSARRQAGHSLVLAMISLGVISIGAVASVSVANQNIALTGSFLSHKSLTYAAYAGLDHGSMILGDPEVDLPALMLEASAAGGCLEGWISTDAGASYTPEPVLANGREVGRYSVDLCVLTCAEAAAGEQLNSTDSGMRSLTVAMDLVATGYRPDEAFEAQVGSVLTGVFQAEGCGLF